MYLQYIQKWNIKEAKRMKTNFNLPHITYIHVWPQAVMTIPIGDTNLQVSYISFKLKINSRSGDQASSNIHCTEVIDRVQNTIYWFNDEHSVTIRQFCFVHAQYYLFDWDNFATSFTPLLSTARVLHVRNKSTSEHSFMMMEGSACTEGVHLKGSYIRLLSCLHFGDHNWIDPARIHHIFDHHFTELKITFAKS